MNFLVAKGHNICDFIIPESLNWFKNQRGRKIVVEFYLNR
jgi:hypothetical protein